MDNSREAYLGNVKDMIVFKFQKTIIRLRGSFSLERFAEIKEWDNGYMVVMAKYQHNSEPREEYIDMLPILEKLYINAKEFLEPIKCVSLWA